MHSLERPIGEHCIGKLYLLIVRITRNVHCASKMQTFCVQPGNAYAVKRLGFRAVFPSRFPSSYPYMGKLLQAKESNSHR